MGNADYFSLHTAQVLGIPTDTVWAQVYTLDKLNLLIVLEKKDPSVAGQTETEDIDLKTVGKQVFLRFQKQFEKDEKKNLASLRSLLEKLLSETTQVDVVTLAAAMTSGKGLYVASFNGEVFIRRGTQIQSILKSEPDKLVSASGFLEDGDIVILINRTLADAISANVKEIVSSADLQEVADSLLATIHKLPNQEGLAASLIQVNTMYLAPSDEEETAPSVLPSFSFGRLHKKFLFWRFFPKGRAKRVLFTVFLLLVVLFAVSLVLGLNTRTGKASLARYTKVYSEATQKYDEGMALSDLNPALATKNLTEAKEIVDLEIDAMQAQRIDEQADERVKLLALSKKIEDGLRVAQRIHVLSDVPVFYDITVIKEGAHGKSLSFSSNMMLILDEQNSALYTLTIPQKKGELVSGGLDGPMHEALGGESGYVLDNNGIERVNLQTKKAELAVKKDETWGELVALSSFAGNLYLLDKNTIHKYQGSQGEPRPYIAADTAPDFGNAVSMAIDGAVWVLFSDGRITKFIQGVPESVTIVGIDRPLSAPTVLFADDESEQLSLLDKGNSRIVVIKKTGTYISQYQWDGIADVTDLVVSEKEKKILLLSGSKIYAITTDN